jgi:hypothetical protein
MARGRFQRLKWLPDADGRRALRLSVPAGLLSVAACAATAAIHFGYQGLLEANPALRLPFTLDRVEGLVWFVELCTALGCTWLLAGFLAAFRRGRFALNVVRTGFASVAVWFCVYAGAALSVTGRAFNQEIKLNGQDLDAYTLFLWRWSLLWPALLALGVAALAYLWAWQRATSRVFTGDPDPAPDWGDRILENLRTHGNDPRQRRSMLSSFGVHILVIIVIPFLLSRFGGCVEPYRVPKGSGTPDVAAGDIKVIKVVKKAPKKKRHLLVSSQNAISFYVPDLEDSKMLVQVEKETQDIYRTDVNRVLTAIGGKAGRLGGGGGKMGAGGGKEGGWPDGMENAKVRFIRMEYEGRGWDDGMDAVSRADLNFLDAFHKLTEFKVSDHPESHRIRLLGSYPKGFAPPFIYMTGDGGISVSSSELKIMREYLLDGGMLFADCGSPQWDRSFRAFAANLLPGQPLLTIADDDSIFQIPYTFSNGAPPLWHHGGMRALGIKYKNRWVVFYHPGDINDAWKTGHSGMDPIMADDAFRMGVNIVYYSFTHYLELTKHYRK